MSISIVFISQCYFNALKDARLNSAHCILMKIGNKKELRNIAEEESGNVNYKDFLKLNTYCTSKPYCFMTTDARPNASMLVFRKNFTESPYKSGQIKILNKF